LPPFTQPHFLPLLHSGNGSIEDAIYCCCLAYPGHLCLPAGPIKGDELPRPSPTLFPSLSSSLTPSSSRRRLSPPSCCIPTAARASVRPELGSLCSPLSVALPLVSSLAPEWPRGQPLTSHRRGPVRGITWISAAHGPRMVDRVHYIFPLKKVPRWKIPTNFVVSTLPFCEINPQSTNFQEDPWFSKIIPNMPLATFQKFQIGPYNFFSPYLRNRNSDFSDSYAKIPRITFSFILCIH
jgi:hypothetical protein